MPSFVVALKSTNRTGSEYRRRHGGVRPARYGGQHRARQPLRLFFGEANP